MFFFKRNKTVPVGLLHAECDFHSHLLPGVDDGKFTAETSVKTIGLIGESGMKELYLTPHVLTGLYNDPTSDFSTIFEDLSLRCRDLPVKPNLHLAAEYMCDSTFLNYVADNNSSLLTMQDDRVLIEMSYYSQSPQIFDIVFELAARGFTPVVAHPERYCYWAHEMDNYDRLKDMGCEFQLNILSATGAYGELSLEIVDYLFENGYYSHVGSDLHSERQYDLILGSSIRQSIATAGQEAGLWSID